jgi:hypothetical protein
VAQAEFGRLLGLGVVIAVAVLGVLLLLRLSARGATPLGYPPDRFPAQELTRGGPLAALVVTQARLAVLERRLPPRSDQRIWLRALLNELREIMDTAYRVALISQVYGQPEQLERLVDEVREIEAGVAEHVTRRMLAHNGAAQDELLAGRMATLRLCVRELASLAPNE